MRGALALQHLLKAMNEVILLQCTLLQIRTLWEH